MIEKYTLDILQNHVGLDRRITSKSLLNELNKAVKTDNRTMRTAIENLRQTQPGSLICSTTKNGGGYFIAASKTELDDYLKQDEHRCFKMWNRIKKQRQAAGLSLDESLSQPALFYELSYKESIHYDYD